MVIVWLLAVELVAGSDYCQLIIMQRIEELIQTLRGAVRNEVKDHSLLAQLNQQLQKTPLDINLVSGFTRAVFLLYDLSNHHSLLKGQRAAGGVQHDELALEMKLTVFKMLASLVVFYSESGSPDPPAPLLKESLQIMVLVGRLFIDLGQSAEIRPLYPLVSSCYQAAQGLSAETEMLHHLNVIELMRLEVDRGTLDVQELRRALQGFFQSARNVPNSGAYRQLAQQITLQVMLKLMRGGANDKCKPLRPFLPEKLAHVITQVQNFESKLLDTDLPQLRISPFYELYLSLKDNPQQVSEERLRAFISSGENFKDLRVFDVVALSGCLLPLEIWLETYINTRERSQGISAAYRCFTFVTDKFLGNAGTVGELVVRHEQRAQQREGFLKVSQLIMLALLLEKRETQEPVGAVLKRVVKVMAHCVVGLHPNPREMRQFGEKATLVCGKFGLGQLGKAIGCLGFYYEVLMGTANEQSYSRFYKSNLMEKGSHIFKTIKLAYEIRTGKASLNPQDAEWVRKEPYLAVLFQKDLKESIILSIPPQEFAKPAEKFEIYFMLCSNLQSQEETVKLLGHMQETLIWTDLAQISKLDIKYIAMSISLLMKLLQNKESQSSTTLCRTAIVLLYLTSITHFNPQLITISNGILLNRYSKLMKLLSLGFESVKTLPEAEKAPCIQRYLFLSKAVLCWSLEQLKLLQANSGGGTSATSPIQPGSLLFYDLLLSFVLSHEKSPQHVQFIRFVRFEMACLTDTVSDNELTLQKNLKLLKLFCSSRWIKKSVKLKILRKLIKEELVSESRQVSLEDLNDLILLADDPRQRRMYAEYLLKLFGEQGKQYLMMQSSSNPQPYEFLTTDNDEDDLLL